MATSLKLYAHVPIALAAIGLLWGGLFLLHRSEAQARDTIRKHHLQDVEDALYFAYSLHGTYPPYDQAAWCGYLSETTPSSPHSDIETALRQQHEKYANAEKPFPIDPLGDTAPDYFYWKRSPAVFELYSILEADPNHTRSTTACPSHPNNLYDYGINSRFRS